MLLPITLIQGVDHVTINRKPFYDVYDIDGNLNVWRFPGRPGGKTLVGYIANDGKGHKPLILLNVIRMRDFSWFLAQPLIFASTVIDFIITRKLSLDEASTPGFFGSPPTNIARGY
jgi:hypothetical protein